MQRPAGFSGYRRAILLFLACIYCSYGYGKIEVIDEKNGLSNSMVRAITKDRNGLMWIGTANGLNKYDGYTFTKTDDVLGDLMITCLVYNEQQGSLWVGTEQGLYVLADNGEAPEYIETSAKGRVTSLLLLRDTVYVAYRDGILLAVWQESGKSKVRNLIGGADTDVPLHIRYMAAADGNSLLLCAQTTDILYRLDPDTRRLDTLDLNKIFPGTKDIYPRFLGRYDSTIILVANNYGLLFFNAHTYAKETNEVWHQPDISGKVKTAVQYGDRMYIMYDKGRCVMVNMQQGRCMEISEQHPSFFRSFNQYYCMYKDGEGNVWIGSNRGIIKFTEDRRLFRWDLEADPEPVSTRAIIEDEAGDLYVGSYTGLYCRRRHSEKWVSYSFPPSLYRGVCQPFGLANDSVGGYIYIASETGFFYRFNKTTRLFETHFYRRPSTPYLHPHGFAIIRDHDGLLWIGSDIGLFTFNPATGIMQYHKEGPFSVGRNGIRQIRAGNDKDILWIATTNGLYKINRYKGVVWHLGSDSRPALSKPDISAVEEDSSGGIWIGTFGRGICIISPDMEYVRYLNREHNGLCNDIVYGMLWDKNSRLWISTFNGLSCYEPATNRFTNYFVSDGLTKNEFNQNSFFRHPDGRMYFGGMGGLNSFYPDSITEAHTPFYIFVAAATRIGFRGRGDTVSMYPSDNSLMIRMGLTDYTNPEYNSFSYRIRGLFDEWTHLSGTPPMLQLRSMAPGRYIVEVRAFNARGIPATNILWFYLHIKLPFYKTWWFYLLLLTFVSMLIYTFFLLKYRGLKKLQQLRIQIASDLHDEVGGLLTRVILFSDKARLRNNTVQEKEGKLERISVLSKEATRSMNDILWAIDARNDFAGNLADRMREYAEEMLFSDQVLLHFDMSADLQKRKIPVHIRQQLYFIYKEAINNIVKHAQATHVHIVYRHENDHFILRVINDGVDKPVFSSAVSGQGLQNIEMRAARIDAIVTCECGPQQFSLTIEKRATT